MNYEEKITDHYRKEAAAMGLSKNSTMHDAFIRNKEIEFILSEVQAHRSKRGNSLSILDLGCGNGYLLSVLTEQVDGCKFTGLEFTDELYQLAISRKLKNTTIIKGDCRTERMNGEQFDVIISERVLINLLSKDDKVKALDNIRSLLKDQGIYIMVESFDEPLSNLNKARKELLLDETKPAYHNEYFNEEIVKGFKETGFAELNPTYPKHYLSSHYFITRVLHEAIRPEEGAIKNTEFVKFFDVALPPAIGEYSPILFRVFEKQGSAL
ncbi:MAG: class I SAM-dependent methyltransferase [Nitrospiraceae bacterium]|nr:class I SAM-dependent methyltransferase [Nitrospiraceae bacterium]